jgi:hypothetical protein
MPRRSILSATERDTLLALPESQDDLIRYYTFNDSDLSLIRQRRGDANRLLTKICQRLVNQQPENLRRSAIFVPVLAVKPAPKRFHTAWTQSGQSLKGYLHAASAEGSMHRDNSRVQKHRSLKVGEDQI